MTFNPSSFQSQGVDVTSHLHPPGLATELREAREEIAYWRGMYGIMVRILAEQHDDPAFAWLDEITRLRAAGTATA